LARLIRERPVFVNLGGSFVYKPARIRQSALSGDFRVKIALKSWISGSAQACRSEIAVGAWVNFGFEARCRNPNP
jgi:hypothetical protein